MSISLDTIERDKYKAMTGIDGLPAVLSAIDETKKYEDLEVKINSVIIRGFNDSEICDLALLAEVRDISVRFIELMPIGPGKEYEGMSREDVKQRLESFLCKKLMWSRESWRRVRMRPGRVLQGLRICRKDRIHKPHVSQLLQRLQQNKTNSRRTAEINVFNMKTA